MYSLHYYAAITFPQNLLLIDLDLLLHSFSSCPAVVCSGLRWSAVFRPTPPDSTVDNDFDLWFVHTCNLVRKKSDTEDITLDKLVIQDTHTRDCELSVGLLEIYFLCKHLIIRIGLFFYCILTVIRCSDIVGFHLLFVTTAL